MTKGLKKFTAGLLSASVILAHSAMPVFAENAVSDGAILDIDFDKYESLSDMPSGFASPSQGAGETQMELVEDGGNGKVLKVTRAKGSSASFVVEQPIENGTIDPEQDYIFSYRFKLEGTGWYGDFIHLLDDSAINIVNTAIYNTFFQAKTTASGGNENMCNGKIGDGTWVTMDIAIHPSTKSYDVKATFEESGETKEQYSTDRLSASNFAKFGRIKLKSNPDPSVDTALYIDYISLRQSDAPEATPTPEITEKPVHTPDPGIVPEWDFDNCQTDEDIPSGWQFNQNDYTTRLIEDDKGGKAIKYEKPDGNNTEIKVENSFTRIQIDKTSNQLYEYGFSFKTDGTCFYGDFGKLLASDTAEVVPVNLYVSDLRVANQTLTNDVGKQDGWMKLRIVINPKEAFLNAYIDYEIDGAPVHKELRGIAMPSSYSNAATIKFKRNATADAVGFALDDIYFRETSPEAPEVMDISPNDGAVGVEVDSQIRIAFSKEITEASVTDENILLLDSNGSPAAKTLELSPDRKTVTITPSSALSQNSSYTISILYLEAEDGGKTSKPWSASFMTEGEYNDGGIFDGKDNINIVYLGGSITAGTGASSNANRWTDKVTEYFKNQYPDKKINGINKGVGGTGSDVGYFRLTSDVIANSPDMVFIEFAVNDKDNSFNDAQMQMEGIVRRLQALDKPPIIVYIYTTNQTFNAVDTSIRAHQSVADYYGIGTINLRDYMKSLVDAGKLTTADFLADGTHPNDTGYDYYAKYIISQLRYDTRNYLKTVTYKAEKLNPNSYEFDVKYDAARNAVLGDGWIVNGDYIESSTLGSSVEYEFYGPMLAMEHWISTGSGQLKVEIDGEVYDPAFDTYYYATGGQSVYWFKALDLEDTKHTVKLTIIGKHANSAGYLVRIKNFLVSNDEPNAMEVMRSVPQNGEIAQTDTVPALYFTRQAAAESVNGSNFRITDAAGGIVDAVVAKDQTDGRIIRITPIEYLENNAVYTVTAKAGIKAMEGDFVLAEDYVFTFTTDSSDPSILVWDRFEDDSLINKWADLSQIAGYEISRVDGYDGKSLRIAKTSAGKSNMNARLNFEDKGEGIYRVSYKFRAEKQGLYIQDLMSVYGKTLQSDGTVSDGQSIVQILVYPADTVSLVAGGKTSTTLLSGIQNMPAVWFDISYVLNTYTDSYDITVTYKDEDGNEKIINNKGLALNADILSINSVRFKTNTNDDSGESSYLFDDLKIEKVKQPKILSITPLNGAKDVSLRPDIEILFSERMDEKTITSSNIRILKGDEAIAEDNYTVTAETTPDGVTKAIIKLVNDLDYKSDYKIVVSSTVSNGALAIGSDVISSFTTRPLDIDIQSVSIKDANNNDVTSLKDMAGKTVYVRMTLKNYDGSDPQSYVSTVSVNGIDDETLLISTGKGEISKGGTEQVISSQISVPEGAENISCFVWNSFSSMLPLINKQVLGN